MSYVYNVVLNSKWDIGNLNTSNSVDTFAKYEDARAFFDIVLDEIFKSFEFKGKSLADAGLSRERLNADFFSSADIFKTVYYGESFFSLDLEGEIAWYYRRKQCCDVPNYEEVKFELFTFAWNVAFENGEEHVPDVELTITRVPIFNSIDEYNHFWEPDSFDEDEYYKETIYGDKEPIQYSEWSLGEIIDDFEKRSYSAFPFDYPDPVYDDDCDEGFFENSISKEMAQKYLDEHGKDDLENDDFDEDDEEELEDFDADDE